MANGTRTELVENILMLFDNRLRFVGVRYLRRIILQAYTEVVLVTS